MGSLVMLRKAFRIKSISSQLTTLSLLKSPGAARTRQDQGAGGTAWHSSQANIQLGKASQVAKIERLGSDGQQGGVPDAGDEKTRAISSAG